MRIIHVPACRVTRRRTILLRLAAAAAMAAVTAAAAPVHAQLAIEQLYIEVTVKVPGLPVDIRSSSGPGVPALLTAAAETPDQRAFAMQTKNGFFQNYASTNGTDVPGDNTTRALTIFDLVVSTDTPDTPLILDFDFLGAHVAGTAYYGDGDMSVRVSQYILAGFGSRGENFVEVWGFSDTLAINDASFPKWTYSHSQEDTYGIGLPVVTATLSEFSGESFTSSGTVDVAPFHGSIDFGLLQPGQTFSLRYEAGAQIFGTLTYPYRGPLSNAVAVLIDPFSLGGGNPPPQLSLRGLTLPSAQAAADAPEPTTVALFAVGLLPIAGAVWRRRRKA